MIEFDDATHTYTRNNQVYTSVTTLLKKYNLSANYNNIPTDVLQKAASRGHATHKAIENYIKLGTDDPNNVDLQNLIKYTTARNIDIANSISEEVIYDDMYQIAGTIDWQYIDMDDNVIADFKTTATIHWESVAWQLSIYNYMKCKGDIIQYYVNKLKVIHLYQGKLTVREVPTIEYDEVVKLLTANLTGDPYTYQQDLSVILSDSETVMLKAILNDIDNCNTLLKDLEGKKKTMQDKIQERMINNNLHKCKIKDINISYVEPTVTQTINKDYLKTICDIYGLDIDNFYTKGTKKGFIKLSVK